MRSGHVPRQVQGIDGRHQFKPTVKRTAEERARLEVAYEKISIFIDGINTKSLPRTLGLNLLASKRWIKAGLRQAEGLKVGTSHPRDDLPTERELIRKADQYASEADALISVCTGLLPSAAFKKLPS